MESRDVLNVFSQENLKSTPIVVYLVINRIKDMPRIAIESCLMHSNSNIVVGYLHESDLTDIPVSPRISFLKLDQIEKIGLNQVHGKYFAYDTFNFFALVAYKWLLFKKLFEQGVAHIIYCDLDVIWFSDVSKLLVEAHKQIPGNRVLIQSATTMASSPRLCMGLASFLNSSEVLKLIDNCFQIHVKEIESGNQIGDDDVISKYYKDNGYPIWIRELPQIAYPVGNMINAYKKKSIFPGLNPPEPAIFHANYTIGENNKILLLKIARSMIIKKRNAANLGVYWSGYLLAKRCKFFLSSLYSAAKKKSK